MLIIILITIIAILTGILFITMICSLVDKWFGVNGFVVILGSIIIVLVTIFWVTCCIGAYLGG